MELIYNNTNKITSFLSNIALNIIPQDMKESEANKTLIDLSLDNDFPMYNILETFKKIETPTNSPLEILKTRMEKAYRQSQGKFSTNANRWKI